VLAVLARVAIPFVVLAVLDQEVVRDAGVEEVTGRAHVGINQTLGSDWAPDVVSVLGEGGVVPGHAGVVNGVERVLLYLVGTAFGVGQARFVAEVDAVVRAVFGVPSG